VYITVEANRNRGPGIECHRSTTDPNGTSKPTAGRRIERSPPRSQLPTTRPVRTESSRVHRCVHIVASACSQRPRPRSPRPPHQDRHARDRWTAVPACPDVVARPSSQPSSIVRTAKTVAHVSSRGGCDPGPGLYRETAAGRPGECPLDEVASNRWPLAVISSAGVSLRPVLIGEDPVLRLRPADRHEHEVSPHPW
jgi:hypothetical protein